jgi:GT2 family glycosyltransferase
LKRLRNRLGKVIAKPRPLAADAPCRHPVKVSVVLSCFNRSSLLRHSLSSIVKQSFASPLEIVIVNDGQENDETKMVCDEFSDKLTIKYIFSGHRNAAGLVSRNPCVPNNIAVKQSTGDVIILTCPEIYHVNNVVDQLVGPVLKHPRRVTTPKALYFDNDNNIIQDLPQVHLERAQLFINRNRYPFCMGMLKSTFMTLGGFDEDFANAYGAEDDDFIWRLRRAGFQTITTKACAIHLWHPSSKDFIPDWQERRDLAKKLYYKKKTHPVERNTGRSWGVISGT